MSEVLRVAIAGLGTVGGGVVKILEKEAELITTRAGKRIEIVCVNARSRKKDRGFDLSKYKWEDDPVALASLEDCDVVVELIGGENGVAKALVEKALSNGKHVVSANKALIAHHGYELANLAEQNGKVLSFEAAVAGSIPVIKAMKEGFSANNIKAVFGILNGTCNYIMCEMKKNGTPFEEVLAEAQAEGYAEADPTLDVGGFDAAHKLCILTSIAFGVKPDFDSLRIRGIDEVSSTDIIAAQTLGYTIKLLGIARRCDNGKIIQMVEPCLVPDDTLIASVDSVFNAVQLETDNAGKHVCTGRGAGELPTASAVIADLVDIARGYNSPCFGVPVAKLKEPDFEDYGKIQDKFFLRLNVLDQPGVIADVSAILRDHNISIESMLQHGRDPGQVVSIVITTHEAFQSDIEASLIEISGVASIKGKPCVMRIEGIE